MSKVSNTPFSDSTSKTPLAQGNSALCDKEYERAIRFYIQALQATPALGKSIRGNIELARQRYQSTRQTQSRQRVAVCGWELAHNAAGRVYTLAKLYEAFADIEIIGSIFPMHGREVWEPIRNTSIPRHTFVVEDQSRFIEQAIELVVAHPYDIVHLSKPRAPNIFFGILYKLIWGARVLVDIDDEELAFVDAETPIKLSDHLQNHGKLPDLRNLEGKEWTQIAVGMANEFDGITVSNPALHRRYGGEIVRHARDEKCYQPSPELKRKSREKFGIGQDKKVVLFCGTPRRHKGLQETADAIASLGRKDVVFAILGNFPDPSLKADLLKKEGVTYKFIENQPYDSLHEAIAIGDVLLLLSSCESPIARYQTPAKLSDALAMEIQVLASGVLSLQEFESGEVITLISDNSVGHILGNILDSNVSNSNLRVAARDLFTREFSFSANIPRLRSAFDAVADLHTDRIVSANLTQLLRSVAIGMRAHSKLGVCENTSIFLLIDEILAVHEPRKVDDGTSKVAINIPPSYLSDRTVDVIVPVFNALEDTKRCLEAVALRSDGYSISVYVVNDGSEEPTSNWLRQFCKERAQFHLIEHSTNLGYTYAVNSGMKASTAPYVVTLNSDTIVTTGWLRSLMDCIESDSKIGVVGPLFNSASWQNVPFLRDVSGNFAINEIPKGLTTDRFAAIIKQYSKRRYPRLSFINGFCFLIRRAVLDTIGFMDEATFPMGYGVENDFCIRAADAGFTFAVADDAYVYHEKSKSFDRERRTELSRKANDLLRKKHGTEKFNSLLKRIVVEGAQLDAIRQEVIDYIDRILSGAPDAAASRRSRTHSCRQKTTDMHGIEINLLPPPAFGTKDYEVDPAISGPCLIFPFDIAVGTSKDARQNLPNIGIHLHLYYGDLHSEFSYFLKNVPYPFTLYVSVVRDDTRDAIAHRLSAELPLADVHVEVHQNRGRDIAPFLVGFGKRLLKHDFICHIHSKRSLHNRNKADWRRQLLVNLLGSPAVVASVLNVFHDSPNVGLIFPEYHHSLRGQISWGTNYGICLDLAKRLRISIAKDELALFPAGSMFWARREAVSRLLELPLTWANFPAEAGQIDGTYAHAVERLLGEIAVSEGFEIIQAKAEKQHSLIFYHPHKWPYRLPLNADEVRRSVERYRAEKPKRTARYAVYTALTGGYDQPVFHERLDTRFDYFLYTDSPANDRGFLEVRPIEYMNDRAVRRARHIKVNPHKYFPEYEVVVWIDANVVIRGDISKYVEFSLDHPDVPFFGIPHPQRTCIYEEAEAVVAANKDTRERVDAQINKYRKEGYPKGNGLIETNFFVANLRHPVTAAIFEEWSSQIECNSHRDQLSLNYALWKVGAQWLPLLNEKITLRDSFDFAYLGHGKNSGYPSALNVPHSKVVFV